MSHPAPSSAEQSSVGDQAGMVLQEGGRWSAEVAVVGRRGLAVVSKDYSHTSALFRNSIGRLLVANEVRALQRLQGLGIAPDFLGRPSPYRFLMQWVEGRMCLAECQPFTRQFFARLEESLRHMRANGVLHLDVGRNVLRTPKDLPILLDFASSIVIPSRLHRLFRGAVSYRSRFDSRAISKLKRRVAPELLDGVDEERLQQPIPLSGVLSFVARRLNRVVRRFNHR